MQLLWTTDIHSSVYNDALTLRKQIFVNEQNVPIAIEIDALEDKCHHVVAYNSDNTPIATARLYLTNAYGKVQRVAVAKIARGQKIGRTLMLEVEEKAKQLHQSTLKLGAQAHAVPFYEKLGYTMCSPAYEEAGITHFDMMKKI